MKKIIALTMALALTLTLTVSCSNTSSGGSASSPQQQPDSSQNDSSVDQNDSSMKLTSPVDVTFVTGSVNGSWYSQAGLLSESIRKGLPSGSSVTVQPGGGVSNIATISNGDVDIGHAHTCYAGWAYDGSGPFDQVYDGIKGVCTLDQMFLLLVADANCGFDSLSEIADNQLKTRITTQRPSSDGGAFLTSVVLEEYGLGSYQTTDYYQNLVGWGGSFLVAGGHGEAAEFMSDGKADLWGLTASAGQAQVVELSANRDIKFIPIDQDVLDALCEKYGLSTYTVPAGTFEGQDEDYVTISVMSTLSANVNTPDEIVYAALDALAKDRDSLVEAIPNLATFVPETAWQGIGYDLHPGAEKWYKDHGYMK